MMFSTIVVGTDGSPEADAAVRKAGEIALASGSDPVHVVSGHRPMSGAELSRLASDLPGEFSGVLTSDAAGVERADEAAAVLRGMHVACVEHVPPSNGTDALLDVAEQVGADLIVVGSRGLGTGGRLLRGSVSTKVAHHAPCSVLIVHSPCDSEDVPD